LAHLGRRYVVKSIRMTFCLVVTVLSIAAGQGFGQIQYGDGGGHDITSEINDDVSVHAHTTVNILATGSIMDPYKLDVCDYSKINISGGSVGDLKASANSQVTVSGGAVNGYFKALGNSRLTISGGTIAGDMEITEQAILTIEGSGFAIDGISVNLNDVYVIMAGGCGDNGFKNLTGTLASGDTINSLFHVDDSASIRLVSVSGGATPSDTTVPEPATLLALGLGGVLVRRFRR
jgi:hypothetical protein